MESIEKLLFDTHPLPVFIYDAASWHFLHINPAAIHVYGYTEDEFLKMTVFDLLSEKDREGLKKMIHKEDLAQADGHKWQHYAKEGKSIDIRLTSNSVRFGDRNAVLSIVSDITEHLKAEPEPNEELQMLGNFFAVSTDLFFIGSPDGIVRMVSKSWENLLGIAIKDMEGVNFLDFVHPEDQPDTLNIMAYLIDGIEVTNFVNRYRKPDGNYIPLEWRARLVGNHIYATARDITDQNTAKTIIKENEEFLTELLDLLNKVPGIKDIRELLRLIAAKLLELFKSDNCYIARWDSEKHQSVQFWPDNQNMESLNRLELAGEKTFTDSILKEKRVLTVEDVFNTPYASPKIAAQFPNRSIMGIPVTLDQGNIGAIIIGFNKKRTFSSSDIERATLSSKILSIVIDKIQYLDQLQQQEKLFRSLIEDAPLGIMASNNKEECVLVNQTAADMLGYQIKELLHMNARHILHPSHRATGNEYFERMRNGVPAITETLMVKKDGSAIWASLRGVKLKDDLYVAFFSDISEHVESKEALAREKALLSALLNSIPDIVFYKDIRGKYIGVNPEFERAIGKSLAETRGSTDFDLFDNETAREFTSKDAEVISKRQPEIIKESLTYPDGSIVHLETLKAPIYDEKGALIGIIGLSRNISERRKLEQGLKENDEMLKTITANVPGIIVQIRYFPDGRITIPYASRGYRDYFPVNLQDIKKDASQVFNYIHPEDLPHLASFLFKSPLKVANYEQEFRIINRRNETVWMKAWALPRKLNDGSVLWHGYIVDNTEKKILEEKLSDSEKTLQEILNTLEEVVWVTDLKQKQFTFVTPSVENLFGYTVNDFRENSQLFMDVVHPDDIHLIKRLSDFDNAQNKLESQYRIIRADGQIRWTLNKIWLIRDPQGIPIRMEGIIIDITKTKQLENEILNISSLQNILLGMANNFINLPVNEVDEAINRTLEQVGRFVGADRAYIFDYDFTNNTCSNTYEWCAIGIQPEIEHLQEVPLDTLQFWVETHLKKEAVIIANVFDLAEDNGARVLLEPQGVKSLIAFPMFDQNELVGFIGFDSVKHFKQYSQTEQELLQFMGGIIVNANSRKGFESALIESEERFRQLADNVDDIFWLNDVETQKILYKNPAFIRFFGMKPSEANSNLESICENIFEEEKGMVKRCLETKSPSGPCEMEIRLYNRQNELRWFRLRVHPVLSAEGTIKRQVGIATDITGLKKAEVALKEALEMERKLGELKSSFVSMASHEFRTPLASIMMAAETMRYYQSKLTEEDNFKYLDRITRNVEFLSDIISKVLNLSKIESGRIPFAPEKMDLALFTERWLNDFLQRQTVNHQIIFTNAATQTSVEIDPQLFSQVIQNLVSNSIKYSAENSGISITLQQQDNMAILSISDQGAGIPEEDFPYLFDPFFRSKNIENVHGTGLGLPIVKKIIERHDGKVYFTSKVNTGTTFYIEIPLSEGN